MYIKKAIINGINDLYKNEFNFMTKNHKIKKWNLLKTNNKNEYFLIKFLLNFVISNEKFQTSLKNDLKLNNYKNIDLEAEFVHYTISNEVRKFLSKIKIDSNNGIDYIKDKNFKTKIFTDLKTPYGYFVYGLNGELKFENVSTIYDEIPRRRSSRFLSFFNSINPLTDIEKWLCILHKNSTQHKSCKSERIYNTTISTFLKLFPEFSSVNCKNNQIIFNIKNKSFSFNELSEIYKIQLLYITDFIRQLSDSNKTNRNFNFTKGILFVHRMDIIFQRKDYKKFINSFSYLFPNIQFIVTAKKKSLIEAIDNNNACLTTSSNKNIKNDLYVINLANKTKENLYYKKKELFYKNRFNYTKKNNSEKVVALFDIDSKIPNLALMKISKFYKNKNIETALLRKPVKDINFYKIYASAIFNRKNLSEKITQLLKIYKGNIITGGSGIDINSKLPENIEYLKPDYLLYPGMNYGMGYLTRGCPNKCQFCIISKQNNNIRRVADIDNIIEKEHKKVVLLDDNLLSYEGRNEILKDILKRNLQINFNQPLDIRLLNYETAKLLLQIDSRNFYFDRRMYYFSLNNNDDIPIIQDKINILKSLANVYPLRMKNITFVCMFGYDTTLSEDIERFAFIKNTGCIIFVQEYQPIINVPAKNISNFFDADITSLLNITFNYNGKNFENYLKWLSKKYVEQFGKLYMPLVDKIFKYNNKELKYKYIKSFAGYKNTKNGILSLNTKKTN